jgi:hypothetical protein
VVKRKSPIKYELLRVNHIRYMMHKQKLFTSYFAGILSCNRSSDAYSGFIANNAIIYPVNNKWGKQGWTIIEMNLVHKDIFEDAITTAYCTVASKKLAEQVRPK